MSPAEWCAENAHMLEHIDPLDIVEAWEEYRTRPHQPQWPQTVKDEAYKLDPECWVSYSGKPRDFKRAMDVRRLAALRKAEAGSHG